MLLGLFTFLEIILKHTCGLPAALATRVIPRIMQVKAQSFFYFLQLFFKSADRRGSGRSIRRVMEIEPGEVC